MQYSHFIEEYPFQMPKEQAGLYGLFVLYSLVSIYHWNHELRYPTGRNKVQTCAGLKRRGAAFEILFSILSPCPAHLTKIMNEST